MKSAHARRPQITAAPIRFSQVLPGPEVLRKGGLIFLASAGVYCTFGHIFPPIPQDSQVSFWESVIAGSQDPYPLLYTMWPILVLVSASVQQGSLTASRILRRGALWAAVVSEATTGALLGCAAGVGAAAGSAITATGHGLDVSWSAFAHASSDSTGSQVLSAFASTNTPVLSALVIPVFAWAGALAAASAGLALASRASRLVHRVSAAALILLPPILFRTDFLPPVVNPASFLMPMQLSAHGLNIWIHPCIAFGIAAMAAVVGQSGQTAKNTFRILRTPRGAWFLTALLLASLLLLQASPEDTAAEAVFYGTSPAGVSFVHWAYGVIVWLGLVMVSLVRWSEWVLPRFSLVALRYGTSSRVVVRELLTDTARTLTSAFALIVLCAIGGAALGLAPASWADWIQAAVGGTAASMTTLMLALAAVWATSRVGSAALVLVAAGASTLPAVNPLWPAPSATGFLGAWEYPWAAATSAISFCTSSALLILTSKFRRLPEVDRR